MTAPFLDHIKILGMQNLMLESELIKLEESGIEIEHIRTLKQEEVVDPELFERDILQRGRRMADFYVLYFSLENTIRRLISGRLLELHGSNWWQEKIPKGVQDSVTEKQEKEKDTPMSIRSDDRLSYTNFGELIDILNSNWVDFNDTLRSKKRCSKYSHSSIKSEDVITRTVHLNEDEIIRFKLLIKDWFRIQS